MPKQENFLTNQTPDQPATEQERRTRLISRYIENIINSNDIASKEEENEIREYYDKLDTREKADILYEKMMAYLADKQAKKEDIKTTEPEEKSTFVPDPVLLTEIKVLFEDSKVKVMLPATYGEARIDARKLRSSELSSLWNNICEEIQQKENEYKKLEKDLFLNTIEGRSAISTTESRMGRLASNLTALNKRKENIKNLKGYDKVTENTDVVAQFQYEKFKETKKEIEQGFAWLPSRMKIHQETISAILNHRWPVLIGEAGSGKSDQADAAAIELTGYLPTEIECESNTGETQLIKDLVGENYEEYGALMSAFTGYENSKQTELSFKTGRIARFDESGRLGTKGYSIIKKARQKKVGDDFYGKPVLSGASAIWTSNPVGPRYPDRHAPDPAMRRELAEIYVDYPEMSIAEPEIYEFAVSALMDENNHIAVAKEEIAPAYKRKDIPENEREVLDDGSIVVAEGEIISDMSDKEHGALWRFSAAIKAVQNSFVYGNSQTEKYPDTILRFKEDANGNIDIDNEGEPLTLSTSTITLGELGSWMSGFNDRRQKQDENFHVNTLTEWLNFKIATYLKQADKADKEKIRAIFKYFNFLENSTIKTENFKPLTPKEIGYLSPRVPRPVYVEKPQITDLLPATPEDVDFSTKDYLTKEVMLEDAEVVLIKTSDFSGKTLLSDNFKISPEQNFMVDGKNFIFDGMVDDENKQGQEKLVGHFSAEKALHKIFDKNNVEKGIIDHLMFELTEDIKDHWKVECENNVENNPSKLELTI